MRPRSHTRPRACKPAGRTAPLGPRLAPTATPQPPARSPAALPGKRSHRSLCVSGSSGFFITTPIWEHPLRCVRCARGHRSATGSLGGFSETEGDAQRPPAGSGRAGRAPREGSRQDRAPALHPPPRSQPCQRQGAEGKVPPTPNSALHLLSTFPDHPQPPPLIGPQQEAFRGCPCGSRLPAHPRPERASVTPEGASVTPERASMTPSSASLTGWEGCSLRSL